MRARTKDTARGWGRFLVGFVVLWAVLAGSAAFDPAARWGPAVLAVVLVASVVVSVLLYRTTVREAVRGLGLGRPTGRSILAAAVVSVLVVMVFPVTAALSDTDIPLVADWPWALIGVFTLHGLAEEMVWRGYAFRRLAEGRQFWPAVAWTMPLIAVTHVPIVIASGPVIGVGAMIVAAVTSIAFSKLYVLGGGTLWAPALLHAAIDSFKLVVLPAAALAIYPYLIIVFSLVVPLLVLLVPDPATAGRVRWQPRTPDRSVGSAGPSGAG